MEQRTEKRALFCIAVEIFDEKNVMIGTSLEYLHANDIANAKYLFRLTAPNTKKHRIVSVGSVIGYRVEDKQGKVLSV